MLMELDQLADCSSISWRHVEKEENYAEELGREKKNKKEH